ncbi:ferredoxin [Dermatophilaceae bacterium Soc4.6]
MTAAVTRNPIPAIVIDRIACTGHGVCAAVLPDQVSLDEWGYPVVGGGRPDPELLTAAVRLCPARALLAGRTAP